MLSSCSIPRILLFSCLTLCSLISPLVLKSQPVGVTLVGHLDKSHGVSGSPYFFKYSACWGWVSPDGKEYALISADSGTSIIDLNGDSLREVQFIPGPLSAAIWREIKSYKHYAYVVAEGGGGVQIIDLAGLPDTAVLVRNFLFVSNIPPDSGKNNNRSHTVTIADGYLYCNGSSTWSPGGCLIFSLREDPTNPTFVGKYEPQYIHDSYVRNDTLYAASIATGGGLYVADVRDKANPVQLGKITYVSSGTHNAWASIDGKYAFTSDEVGSTAHDMKVWALDSLPNSVMVAEYRANPTSIVHNVHGRGHYVYVAHYTGGMRVVDVHDPANPFEVGSYDTYPGSAAIYDGCWGVYPYFPSGKWIGSDMQTGLYVCRFDGLKPRVRSRLIEPPESTEVGVTGLFRWTSAANQAEDPHYYELHIKGPGTLDTLFTVRDTVLTISGLAAFNEQGVYTWSLTVKDEYTEVSSPDTFHFIYSGLNGVSERKEIPKIFSLAQNYPNPFNPMTKIEFALGKSAAVTLRVYDVLGHEVRTLLKNEQLGMGNHQVVFDASTLSSGTYFYELQTRDFSETKKMILGR